MWPKIKARDNTNDFRLSKCDNLEGKCCQFWVWFSNILKSSDPFHVANTIRICNNMTYCMELVMVYKKITFRSTNYITLLGLFYRSKIIMGWSKMFWSGPHLNFWTWVKGKLDWENSFLVQSKLFWTRPGQNLSWTYRTTLDRAY